jgi:hypothetical protein
MKLYNKKTMFIVAVTAMAGGGFLIALIPPSASLSGRLFFCTQY